MKTTRFTRPARWFASLTSRVAAMAVVCALTLLMTLRTQAATYTAKASGDLNTATTWTPALPVLGDANIWKTAASGTGSALTWGNATPSFTFYGGTLQIASGGSLSHQNASTTQYNLNNVILESGGSFKHGANSAWNVSFNANGSVNNFTLNGGTISTGNSTGSPINFTNVKLLGSGTVSIIRAGSATATINFSAATVDTTGFTGVFNVNGAGKIRLPAISAAQESFELDIADGTSLLQNDVSIAVKVLKLWDGTALATISPGLYTASSLVAGGAAASCFTLPADTANTIQVGRGLTYDANGGSSPPAPSYWANGATATAAGAGSMMFPGFSFTGWNTVADGTGTAITAGGTFAISAETTLYAQWAEGAFGITVNPTLPASLTTVLGVASASQNVVVTTSGLTADITVGPTTGLEFSNDDVTWGATTTISSAGGTLYVRLAASAAVGSYNNAPIALISGASSGSTATTGSGNAVANNYWISTASGDWSTTTNWQAGAVANGSGITADFSQVDITAETTVYLDARTIGNLIFGDTDNSSAANWILYDNGSSGNILTLAGTTPTVTVNALGTGASVTLSAEVAGTSGLRKAGAGTLILSSAANAYTGGTTVNAGTLALSGSGTLGATSGALTLSGGALDLGTLTTSQVGAVSITAAATGSDTILNGDLTAASYAANLTTGTATISAALLGSGTLTLNGIGGTLALSGPNAYPGLTTVTAGTLTISGNQPAANGGFSIGDNTVGLSTLNINSGATVAVASGQNFKIGRTATTGAGGTVNVAGAVTNDGTLTIGRPGILNINNGGAWNQSGTVVVQGQGNVAAAMKINVGGSFTYTGSIPFGLNCAQGPYDDQDKLTVSGTFTTGQPIQNSASSTNTGRAQLILDGGTLAFSANVTDFVNSSTATPILCVLNNTVAAQATIDTGGFSVSSTTTSMTGAGGLIKKGAGTLTLGIAETYSGATTINAGKLVGVVGTSVTSPVTVAATAGNTAALGVSITDITQQWSCTSLAVDNSLNGGTSSGLDFNFSSLAPSTSVAPLQVNGDVTFTTLPDIRIAALDLPASSGDGYPLMTWTGTGPVPGSEGGMPLTLPNRVAGNLVIVGSTLYLQITGASTQPLTYQGGGTWDTFNPYWKDSAGTVTSYMDGLPGDSVVFDVTGVGGTVTLDSAFNPASVLVNNASYEISGSGSIGGSTGVTKSGSGTLTLSTANTYTGGTTVNGGTLALSGSGTLGSTVAPLTLSGGALDLGALATTQVGAVSITAAATSGDTLANGSLKGSSYAVSLASGNVVISANLLANGTIGLTKSGAGVLTLSGANTYTGATVLNGGELHATTSASALGAGALPLNTAATTLRLANDTGLNFGRNTTVSANLTIQSDTLTSVPGVTHTLGTLSIGANTLSITKGANVVSGTAGLTFGATTLTSGPAVFDVASGVNLTLGAWTGNFNMTKQNSGTLTLGTMASGTRSASVNTLAGGTLVLGGAVSGTQDSLGGPGAALALNGGMLDLATDTSVLAHPTTVGGDVTIQSDKTSAASAGITHTLGTLSLGAQTLTVAGGANVASGTAGLTFGATTLTGAPILVINNPAAGGTTTMLSLGGVTPGANTLTLQGNGNFNPGAIGTGGGGLTLDTSFSGTVTMNVASAFTGALTIKGGTVSATGGTTRLGVGNLILAGGTLDLPSASGRAFNRPTTVNGDFLILNQSQYATPGPGVTNTFGTLAIGNQTLTVSGGNVLSGTAELDFGATTLSAAPTFNIINPTAGGVMLLKLGAIADNGHTVTLKGSGNFAQSGAWGGGAGGLTLDATYTGTATLNQANTYTGATTINGGKLVGVTGGGCANSDVSVANGAALGVKASAADMQWVCKSLTLNSPGTLAEFDFSSALPSTVTAPLQVNGAVTNNGTLQVTITGGLFVAGTDYPLIKYTGLLTAGTLEVVSLPGGVIATLVDNTANSSIDLHVTEGNLLKWTGDTGDWDIASSYNWNSGAKQYLETTLPGDGVLFDDNSPGAGPFTVTLNTLVTPSVVKVNNFAKAYTVSGSGTISGTTGLSKSGSGILTLATANTYSGGTTVSGGAVNVQNNTALGTGAVAVAAGAQLQLEGGVTTGANSLFLGTIANNTAGVLHSISGDNTYGGVITVPGDASVGAATFQCDAGTLTLSNTITRNNGSPKVLFTGAGHIVVSSGMNSLGLASIVTINGTGTYTFSGTNTLMNSMILTAGTLNINSPTAVGSGGTTTFTISGGTIDNTSGAPVTESANLPIIINGDFAFTGTQDLNLGTGTVGLGANALVVRTITANAGTLTLGGIVSGGAALTKAGNGTLTLTGVNTYSGTTTVNAGTLAVTGSSIANAGKLVINGGSVHLTGAETVSSLFFGATQQVAGTYSADGAGGTIPSANFTGSGTLIVTTSPVAGFASWITSTEFGLAAEDQGATADPDNDGMENQLEYVLNGNPSVSDSSILPDLVVTATDFEFSYSRLDLSLADTTQTFEYGDTLSGWTPVVIPAEVGVSTVGIATVTVTDAGSTDTVKVSISKSAIAGSKLFGRLQVVK